jgi:EmrB/QacA subfamily drug resistance transporter
MASSINVALPSIGREFSLSAVALSWIVTSYLLAIAVFLVPFGKAGDLYGRRKVFLWGTIVYTIASLLVGCASSATMLMAFRIVQGIGAAMIFGTGTAMLTSVIEPHKRGSMLGVSVALTYLGLSLGPPLGGLLTQTLGWRSIFYTNVPLGCIILLLVLWKIRQEPTEVHGGGFDYIGSVIYGAALISLMFGLVHLPQPEGIILSVTGAAGLLLFGWVESRINSPVLAIALFRRNTVFTFSNIAALFNYSATAGSGFLISLYLQYVKEFPPKSAGLILIAQPIIMAIFSPFAGKLSDRIESRIVSSLGMAMTAAALFFFSRINDSTPLFYIIAGLMMLGIGVAFFSSPNTSAIMGSVERPFYGMASSIVGTMRLIGQMLSMGIAAMVLSTFVGSAAITPAHHQAFIASTRVSFLIFGILCTVGIFASLARGRLRKKDGKGIAGPLNPILY